jgi:hypothetical protein
MMQYLGVIEQRTNELFQLYSSSSNKVVHIEDEKDLDSGAHSSTTVLRKTPGQVAGLKVAPPGVDDLDAGASEEEEDDDARPLSLDEVERSVMRRIQYIKTSKGNNKRAAREKREREKGYATTTVRTKRKGETA